MSAKDLSEKLEISFDRATNVLHALAFQGCLVRSEEKRERIGDVVCDIGLYGVRDDAVLDNCTRNGKTIRMHRLLSDGVHRSVDEISEALDIPAARIHSLLHVMRAIFEKKSVVQRRVPRVTQEAIYKIKRAASEINVGDAVAV